MPAVKIRCPECKAVLKRSNAVDPGTKIRCPSCENVFRAPDDDEDVVPRRFARDDADDEPRRSRRHRDAPVKKQNTAIFVIGGIAAGILCLGAIAVVLYIAFPSKSKDDEVALTPLGKNNSAPASGAGKGSTPVPKVTSPNAGKVGLNVGDVAMEIDGEDIDGTKFKLSDYRGKVVVLDFWGDW